MKWYEAAGVRNVAKPFICICKGADTSREPHAANNQEPSRAWEKRACLHAECKCAI